jgi:hypothetical protein
MKCFLSICLLAMTLLAGCKSRNQAVAVVATNDSLETYSMGKGRIIGEVTVRGILSHTKGRMGQVGGMIISGDLLGGADDGAWLPAYEELVGKNVQVAGLHYRYTCGPIEQCLEGGVIHYLQSITSIRLAAAAAADPYSGYGEVLGAKTVKGILQTGKGDMAEVGDMMIPGNCLCGPEGGNWKPEYVALIGKMVEVRGEHYRYFCGAEQQCLSGGVIDWLRAIEFLKLVE